MADFLDAFIDHLEVKCGHWLFEKGVNSSREEVNAIGDFVAWVRKSTEEDKNVKRGRQGISYVEARDAARSQASAGDPPGSGDAL